MWWWAFLEARRQLGKAAAANEPGVQRETNPDVEPPP